MKQITLVTLITASALSISFIGQTTVAKTSAKEGIGKIKSNQIFTGQKKQRSHKCTNKVRFPFNLHIWQYGKNRGEKRGDNDL